jgi:hypothetical protein
MRRTQVSGVRCSAFAEATADRQVFGAERGRLQSNAIENCCFLEGLRLQAVVRERLDLNKESGEKKP